MKKIFLFLILIVLTGCSVGPDYTKPTVAVPADFKEIKGWKEAQPRDQEIRTKWWEEFGDPALNSLMEQVNVSNQSIALVESQYRQALAQVQLARADYFPSIGAGASYTRNSNESSSGVARDTHQISLSSSWEIDLWGKVRRQVEAGKAAAEASFADLQAIRLSMQAQLAINYFQLRTLDAQKKNLDDAVAAYRKALELTQNRYNAGVAARADVVTAQTQLQSAQSAAVRRALRL